MKLYSEFLYAAMAFACKDCTIALVVPHTVLSLALIVSKLGISLEPSDMEL